MTCKQLVALGVRLFCIWLAIHAMTSMSGYWIIASQQDSAMAETIVLAGSALFLLIIVLLWLFPLTVAGKLLPRAALDRHVALAPHQHIESAGFCLLGLWLLTRAVPGLIYDAVVMHLYHANPALALSPQRYATMYGHLVELALAIWLLFGARGLRGLLNWARSAASPAGRADSHPEP